MSDTENTSGGGCLKFIIGAIGAVLLLGFVIWLFMDEPVEMATQEAAALGVEYKQNDGSYASDDFSWLTEGNTALAEKPYTVFMLINGTNLESDGGCATADITEMLDAEFDESDVNVLLLTGGTYYWQNTVIGDDTAIYAISGDSLVEVANLKRASVVDHDVVSAFIDYGMSTFPAEKYGFVFWNHGGGTIGGYGDDELHDDADMTIKDIGMAFEGSKASSEPFEFIGFDCCLMATAEVALYTSPYAKYLIASEELEPGSGWDYTWLEGLSKNPGASGAEIGEIIADTFVEYYEESDEEATLSVIDLDELGDVFTSLNTLSQTAGDAVQSGDFKTISKARKKTKSFAVSEPDEDSYDLIDIRHFAERLEDEFPQQSQDVIDAVENAVVYYRNSDNVSNAYGLSTYLPYLSKELAEIGVPFYKDLDADTNAETDFIDFMSAFTNKLTGAKADRSSISRAKPVLSNTNEVSIQLDAETIDEINQITFTIWKQLEEGSDYFIKLGLDTDVDIADDGTITTAFDGYWATLGGQAACFYELERSGDYVKYTTPAVLNGEDVKLVVIFDDKNPDGKLLGALPQMSSDVAAGASLAARDMIDIKKGDKLALKYFAQLFAEEGADTSSKEASKWVTGDEFTVNADTVKVKIEPVGDELYLYGFWIEDIQNNNYYTDFIEIRY